MARISGTGSFGNGPNVYNETPSEFDQEARAALDGLGPSKPKLTPEQVRQAYEEAVAADARINENHQSAQEFTSLHAEYLDTPKNGKLMNDTLKAMFGDGAYSVEQFEAAYNVLRVSNSLDIDHAEEAKQAQAAENAKRKAVVKRRADAASRQFDPTANYDNLSLEELRALADEEIRNDFERRGQEGGW